MSRQKVHAFAGCECGLKSVGLTGAWQHRQFVARAASELAGASRVGNDTAVEKHFRERLLLKLYVRQLLRDIYDVAAGSRSIAEGAGAFAHAEIIAAQKADVLPEPVDPGCGVHNLGADPASYGPPFIFLRGAGDLRKDVRRHVVDGVNGSNSRERDRR